MRRLTSFVAGIACVAASLIASTAWAQQNPPQVDNPSETAKFGESCGEFKVVDCATLLFTGQPLHVAVGSIAPQNGFGAGLAFVGHKTTPDWRMTWDADGLASTKAWRIGWYGKIVHAAEAPIGAHFGTGTHTSNPTELPEHLVITPTVQAISLDDVSIFDAAGALTSFRFRESIFGANVVMPLGGSWHPSVYGEVNGRYISTAPAANASPELVDAKGFVQFGEGFRVRPSLADGHVRLNYDVSLRNFIAPSNSTDTFHRFTADLAHDFPIHSTTRVPWPQDQNGPDECTAGANPAKPTDCAVTRNVEGLVEFRAFVSTALVPDGHAVPFYLQPTLGGSDINGTMALASYQDYRFRAPNIAFLRLSVEHSIFDLPVGLTGIVDTGAVSATPSGLKSATWRYSVSGGVTIRAGGIPAVSILYSHGGSEGGHAAFIVSTTLLGGSSRPSLF
jgi:hypothetical protein